MSLLLTKVLVVEDDDEDYLLLQELFERQGRLGKINYQLERASTAQQALERLCEGGWAFFIVDVVLDPLGSDGVEFVHAAIEQGIEVPALLISGHRDLELDPAAIQLIEQDRMRFLSKSDLNWNSLYSTVRDMVHNELNVLVVDDDPDFLFLIRSCLEEVNLVGVGFEVDCAVSVAEAADRMCQRDYQLLVLDYQLNGEKGTDLLERPDWQWRDDQVILICTGRADLMTGSQDLGLIGKGRCRFLPKSQLSQDNLLESIFRSDADDTRT